MQLAKNIAVKETQDKTQFNTDKGGKYFSSVSAFIHIIISYTVQDNLYVIIHSDYILITF